MRSAHAHAHAVRAETAAYALETAPAPDDPLARLERAGPRALEDHEFLALSCFPQGDRQGIGVAVAMAAELQPAPELAVVGEEDAFARQVHDPGRPGDVAGRAGALEAVVVGVDERLESGNGTPFVRPLRTVCGEACLECVAVRRLGSGRLGVGAFGV